MLLTLFVYKILICFLFQPESAKSIFPSPQQQHVYDFISMLHIEMLLKQELCLT